MLTVFLSDGNSTHDCHRDCLDNSTPKVCTYDFKIGKTETHSPQS